MRVTVVYNEPVESRYDGAHEQKAVVGVLDAVSAVTRSLDELGFETGILPLVPPLTEAGKKLSSLRADVVFNLFEGFCGEPESEALVPEYLEKAGIPYTGCPAPALLLALDKAGLKQLLKTAGIPTPDYQLLSPDKLENVRLKYPCIVKPRGEDASHGITADSIVYDDPSLEKQVIHVSQSYCCDALVEEFLTGREFNATIIGDRRLTILPPSEIVYALEPGMPPLLTYTAKWEPESAYFKGTRVVCPAEISWSECKQIEMISRAAFRLTGCSGYARVDMRMDGNGRMNVLEVNPNPDISPESGAARQAAAAGMEYTAFIDKIIEMAGERKHFGLKNKADVRAG